MKRKTKYTPNVLWLKPFIESVDHLVPIQHLDYVRGYKICKGFEESQYGAIHKDLSNGRYSITLKVIDYVRSKKQYKYGYMNQILETLAHELAHLGVWEEDHSPVHWKLQATILLRFGDVLEKLNIMDTSKRFE